MSPPPTRGRPKELQHQDILVPHDFRIRGSFATLALFFFGGFLVSLLCFACMISVGGVQKGSW